MEKIIFTLLVLLFSSQISLANEETLILFDSSVSMGENINSYPKYMVAVNEAKNVLEKLPPASFVGLRIIGIIPDEDALSYLISPELLCKATKLTVPIASNNSENIKNSLNSLMPLGTTPLVYSLDKAVKYDFSPNASIKHIILITDGIDECNGNICEYAKELQRYSKNVKIDIIAIGVDNQELNHLNCLSSSTSGKVINTKTPDEIKKAFIEFLTPRNYSPQKIKTNDIEYKNILIEFYQ